MVCDRWHEGYGLWERPDFCGGGSKQEADDPGGVLEDVLVDEDVGEEDVFDGGEKYVRASFLGFFWFCHQHQC